jgi:hypothetical protein
VANGAAGKITFGLLNAEEAGRVYTAGAFQVWRVGRPTYNFSSFVSALSIGYGGLLAQFGIALRPQVDNTNALVMENAAGSVVGSITQSPSTTTYNTTSDYRLKHDIADLGGSGAFIDALRPREWRWAETGERGAGFVAHEAQEVSPSSVTGEKDAIGQDGRPVYQGMMAGSSEIIANLVDQVRELRARVLALEARG